MNAILLDKNKVLEKNIIGLGVEWDPSDIFDYTPEQWKLFVDRIGFLQPPLIRCMSSARAYCVSVKGGAMEYNWNSRMMNRLFQLLDVCEEQGIKVIIGEWMNPGKLSDPDSDVIEMDDPRWGQMIVEFLNQLINVRGYTCVRYYNCVNEPNSRPGGPFDGCWGAAVKNLRALMDSRGFSHIPIIGPDPYADWDNWLDYSFKNVDDCIGEYEVHWYATRDLIRHGIVSVRMRELREKIRASAPDKRFFFGEMGCLTGRNMPGDQQMELPMYWYGVAMADMLAQSFDAGMAGAMAWSFEDSMHLQKYNGSGEFLPVGDDYKDYCIKVWGFWNAVGKAFIDPQGGHGENPEKTGYWIGQNLWEDMTELRPWYYIWAPICRTFRKGSSTIKADMQEGTGLRCAAAIQNSERLPGACELSFYVVNHSDTKQSVRVTMPAAKSACDMAVYEYLSKDSLKKDANGFPHINRIDYGVDMAKGIELSLPAMSVVLYTTLEGGAPVKFG